MTKVAVKSGSTTRLMDKPEQFELYSRNYKFQVDGFGQPFLADFDDFVLPSKMYGDDVDSFTNKVLNSFEKTEGNLGVLLSGLKGTGKSVLVKNIAITANKPTIIVDSPHAGTILLSFLDQCPQSCVVIFDEFEKVYREREHQETLLPLLDGLSTNKHVFLFTVNGDVSSYLEGRPSRIRYHKRYTGLDKSVISDLLDDILVDPGKKEELFDFVQLIPDASMDLVCSLANERNLYPEETLEEMAKTFNFDNPMDREYNLEFTYPVVWLPNESEISEEDKRALFREFYPLRSGDLHDCTYDDKVKAKFEEAKKKYPDIIMTEEEAMTKHSFKLMEGLEDRKLEVYMSSWFKTRMQSHSHLSKAINNDHVEIPDFSYLPEKGGKLGIYSGENRVGTAKVVMPYVHHGVF